MVAAAARLRRYILQLYRECSFHSPEARKPLAPHMLPHVVCCVPSKLDSRLGCNRRSAMLRCKQTPSPTAKPRSSCDWVEAAERPPQLPSTLQNVQPLHQLNVRGVKEGGVIKLTMRTAAAGRPAVPLALHSRCCVGLLGKSRQSIILLHRLHECCQMTKLQAPMGDTLAGVDSRTVAACAAAAGRLLPTQDSRPSALSSASPSPLRA